METVCRWFAYSLGVVALNDREVMVSQRPELTLLKDLDGDGVADEYSAFSDGFGVSGNYHEFHFGPVRDKAETFTLLWVLPQAGGRQVRETGGSTREATCKECMLAFPTGDGFAK